MVAPLEQQQDFAANYGWALSVLRSSPDLSKLFDRAIAGGYNQSRFVAELRNTNWYKGHSESARQGLVLQKADPAEYKRRIAQAAAMVADQYYAMTGRRMSGPTAAHLGQTAFLYGFNDNEVRDMVSKTVSSANLMKGGIGGTLGDAEKQLRQAANDYGLDMSETWIKNTVNNIAWQNTDPTAEISKMRQLAKSKYAAYAQQIDGGATIADIAEPFKQLMAKTLEVSDKSISVNDRQIQTALMYAPQAKGSTPGKPKLQAPTGMPLWQFEQQLKNDPRWNKTKGAQDSIMAAGRQVLQDLGFQGSAN